GTTVTVQNVTENDEPETYTIVGSTEADPTEYKISNESPIGSAIIGKAKGDVIKVKVPAGVFEYKVLKIK
ncbi:MAG: GreA/GreB family elongation factor, partial [Candidatus Peregrinibacteria bacterium]